MNCQNCRKPLKLDDSLEDLDPASFDLLIGSAGQSVDPTGPPTRTPYPEDRQKLYEDAAAKSPYPVHKRSIPSSAAKGGGKDDPTMSFALLTESEVMPARKASETDPKHDSTSVDANDEGIGKEQPKPTIQAMGAQVEAATRLFEILSARSDIDHPMCSECTDLILVSLKSRLDASNKERDAYISFLKSLNQNPPSSSEVSKAQTALASVKQAEAKAFAELQALEQEKANLDEEIAGLEAESLGLDAEEAAFWRSRNAFALELSTFQSERDALNAAYEYDARQLELLRRTNVYNDALHITSDGTFATINGLRLGRLPPKHGVDWSEINAAWGYAALLLATVAEKLDFVFKGFRIKPVGSTSRIEQIDLASSQNSNRGGSQSQKPKIHNLDLFSSGDIPLASALMHRRINSAMVAFLECLRQLCEYVVQEIAEPVQRSPRTEDGDGSGAAVVHGPPYRVKNDKIGSDEKGYVSIRLNASNDAEWTDACKYTLTNCKYLLAVMGKTIDRRGQ